MRKQITRPLLSAHSDINKTPNSLTQHSTEIEMIIAQKERILKSSLKLPPG